MSIHVDVVAELQQRSVQRVADEMERRFKAVGFKVTPEMNKVEVEAVAAYLEKKFGTIHSEVKVDVDHASVARATREIDNFSRSSKGATTEIAELGRQSFQTGRGIATTLGAPIAALIGLDFASWAVTASGALGMIPAAATAAAAGIGTLALATDGFGKALGDMRDPKKFAADLQLLSPASQQAALSIQNLLPAFDQLKHATQDAFFAGIGEQIHNLANTYLPQVQSLTTGIASSFNQMMTNVSNQLMTPETQTQMQTIFNNIGAMFQNLVPAATSFSQAFTDIVEVGSTFLPGFGSSISEMAQNFANFIREARNSGELRQWIQDGIDAVKMLGTELWAIGSTIVDVFGGDAKTTIANFKDDLEGVRQIIALLGGDFSVVGNDINQEWFLVTQTWKFRWANAVDWVIDKLNTFIDQINTVPGLGRLFPDIPHLKKGGDDLGGGGGSFGTAPPARNGWGMGGQPGQPGSAPIPTTPPGLGARLGGGPPHDAGLGPYGGPFAVPPPPPGPAGAKPSDRERLDAIKAGLDPSLYRVDPFAPVPGLPSPGALAGGPMPGGGYGAASAQDFFEGQQKIIEQGHQLEEKRKDRLALERDNQSTAEQITDAKWEEHQQEVALQKAQADLVDKTKGTAKQAKQGMDQLSAALDPDLGLSKGLAGFADNLVRFVGSLALAGPMAKLNEIKNADEAATGITGGYGLFGIHGAQNLSQGLSPLLGNPLPPGATDSGTGTTGGAGTGGGAGTLAMPSGDVMPSILKDTGSTPSGPQSRAAAAALQQVFGSQIRGTIGGSRDTNTAPGTHDAGLSIDIPIAEDQRGTGGLGDQIKQYLQDNAAALGLKYTIWRGQGQYPGGGGFNQGGHQDHIDAHFNGQGVTGALSAGAGGAVGGYGSGVVPVYVTNMGGGGGLPGLGGGAPGAPSGGAPAGMPSAAGGSSLWDAVAKAESSGNWQNADTGHSGHYGGLQFSPETWRAYGGVGNPQDATREQQIAIANRAAFTGYNGTPPQGLQAWEAITKGMVPGVTTGTPASAFGAGGPAPLNLAPGGGTSPILKQWQPGVGSGLGQPTGAGGPSFAGASSSGSVAGSPTRPGINDLLFGPLPQNNIPLGHHNDNQLLGQWGPPSGPGGTSADQGTIGGIPVPASVAAAAQYPTPGGSPGGAGSPGGTAPGTGGIGNGLNPQGMPYGGIEPASNPSGGGLGITPGGSIDTAMNLAASAFPGVGQAAATGMKLANRAVQYAGQMAGIGVEGLMQTFLPTGGSELANNSWFTRIIGGLAGASPQLPNIAGKQGQAQAPLSPEQVAAQQGGGIGGALGAPINVTYNNNGATEDRAGADLTYHLGQQNNSNAVSGQR